MSELWKVVILAIVQGVTEFLPISSDGHLVLASLFLGVPLENDPQLHDLFVVLHFGTLLSIVVVFADRLLLLATHHRRLLWPLFLASIPAGIFGLLIKKGLPPKIENWLLLDPVVTALGFLLTGATLILGGWARKRDADYVGIKVYEAFAIGCAQATAILPGVSRSGMTISVGQMLGLSPKAAASFSFLLGVPVIFAASMLEAVDLLKPLLKGETVASSMSPWLLGLGVVVSFVVGVASLKLLIGILERGRFAWFALWVIPVGVGLLAWGMMRK